MMLLLSSTDVVIARCCKALQGMFMMVDEERNAHPPTQYQPKTRRKQDQGNKHKGKGNAGFKEVGLDRKAAYRVTRMTKPSWKPIVC